MQTTIAKAHHKGHKQFSIFPFVNGLFFLIFCLFILIPLWKVIVDSLDLNTGYGMKLWPENFGLAGYQSVFSNPTLLRPLMISVVTTVTGTFLGLLLSTIGAYVLIQWDMPGRNFFAGMLLFTMIFQGGMIPTYLVMKSYGLINSIWSMILPWAVSSYYVIIMKNYFNSISPSLEEAALIDGAGDLQILVKIILPISMPFTMTFLLFYAVERWNEWWNAYLYINEKTLYPLQIYLREVLINMNNQLSLMAQITSGKKIPAQSVQMGTIIITALPILCVYPFVQKYFVKGVMIGSIKE